MAATTQREGALDSLRREKGMSIYALSKKSGVSERVIGNLCSGKVKGFVRPGTVKKIAEALDLDFADVEVILQGDGIVVGQ